VRSGDPIILVEAPSPERPNNAAFLTSRVSKVKAKYKTIID
jgi:hypothetical protein